MSYSPEQAEERAIREVRAAFESSVSAESVPKAVHKWSWRSSLVPDETIADPKLSQEEAARVQFFVASLTMKDGGGDRSRGSDDTDDSSGEDEDSGMADTIVLQPSSGSGNNFRKRPFSFGIFPVAEDKAAKAAQDSVAPIRASEAAEQQRPAATGAAANPQSRFAGSKFGLPGIQEGSKFGLPGIQDRAASFPRNAPRQAHQAPDLFDHRQARSRFAAPVSNRAPEDMTPTLRTAREQLIIDNQNKNNRGSNNYNSGYSSSGGGGGYSASDAHGGGGSNGASAKRLGAFAAFRSPLVNAALGEQAAAAAATSQQAAAQPEVDERLKNIEPRMVELIRSEIMDTGPPLSWDAIAGLEFVKATVKEIVVFPMLRPDIFTGLRAPSKGLLLFGPPGTGKTLIGKCIASQSGSTFFSISASSLTSKWVGDGEKMVRALFAVARVEQPAVVFIDEIDSLLSQRSDSEHESSRRIKTEFLVQLDGATTAGEERLLVVGATNRPQDLDEAARRRLVKRLYVPLPDPAARRQIVQNLMLKENYSLSEQDVESIVEATDGYSGADMTNLCRDAAMGPIRTLQMDITKVTLEDVRPINMSDFSSALRQVKASVSEKDLAQYTEWNQRFGYSK